MVGQMRDYEKEKGALPPGARSALPPGAKPPDGGGRINHSTNLQIRQPAGYGYANITTTTSEKSVSSESKSKAARMTPTPSSTVNNKALKELEGLGSTFKSMMDRLIDHPGTPSRSTPSEITIASNKKANSKKRKLHEKIEIKQKKKKELMDQITFLEVRKDDEMDWYKKLMADYRKVSKEVTTLIDDLDKDDETLEEIERSCFNN